ncbi:MAG: MBL fold metallo-hydrolase [Dorea sp.]|nr:MBL fold metallo-hydrolase [Dorea sp.]
MAEFIYFTHKRLDDQITMIRDFFGDIMYLIQDEEKAILIDTGFGVGSLRSYVDMLTGGKPVTVLLTHGHMDHAMGAPEFDDVYMSPLDDKQYRDHEDPKYRSAIMKVVLGKAYESQKTAIIPSQDLNYKPLLPGMTFALCGLTIRIFAAAGHTYGSVAMLLEEKRILILGDSCNDNVLLLDDNATNVSGYLDSMTRLEAETKDLYDRVFFSHGHNEGVAGYIASAIEVCKDILAGRSEEIPYQFLGFPLLAAKARDKRLRRYDGGLANIAYTAGKDN